VNPHRSPSPLALAALAALAAALSACDAGGDLLARGADAEAAGNYAEARARYKEACEKSPKHCPLVTRLDQRLSVRDAWKAILAGEHGKAKAALDAAAASADPSIKAAVEAAATYPDQVQGLAWEEASALADKEQALGKIEALVDLGVPVSAKARDWLTKNRPAILLGRAKSACQAGAHASCADAGKALAALHAESPENAEAQRLVQADYARVYPLLKQAENLLIQRVELYDKDQLVELCTEKSGPANADACAVQVVGDRHLPTPSFLDGAWRKKLDEIGDPSFVKALEARYQRAGAGEYDPEPWAKPPGAK
jgi:hypothetical protein